MSKLLATKELELEIQKVITKFESKEAPTIELSYDEKTKALVNILQKRI